MEVPVLLPTRSSTQSMRIILLLLTITTTSFISGCVFSNQVAAIGMYERYGDVPEPMPDETPPTLMVYQRKLGAGGEDGFGIPYQGYIPLAETHALGNYPYTPTYDKQGKLSGVTTPKGKLRAQVATEKEQPPAGMVHVSKQGRSAAGYAAQSLQVLAVPVDTVFLIVYSIVYVTATAFDF